MLNKINVRLGERSYPIYITTNYSHLGTVFNSARIKGKILIVTDTNVEKYQAQFVSESLNACGLEHIFHVIPAGEKNKILQTVQGIYDILIQHNFDRYGCIVALGGGVVGDIAGFAASTFCRGIHFVQMPTTLLATVDSSVGGKVGVDYLGYKNIIGSFYQPKLVYINVNSLKTLPKNELIAGLGEVVKHGVIRSPDLLEYLADNRDKIFMNDETVMQFLIKENCAIKASIIEADEKEESGLRVILNFGHTIGHAIESAFQFSLLHGECVAIGMMGALQMALKLEMIDVSEVQKVEKLLKFLGLRTRYPEIDPEKIYQNIFFDKKIKNGKIYFVLPKAIGDVYYLPIEDTALIRQTLLSLKAE